MLMRKAAFVFVFAVLLFSGGNGQNTGICVQTTYPDLPTPSFVLQNSSCYNVTTVSDLITYNSSFCSNFNTTCGNFSSGTETTSSVIRMLREAIENVLAAINVDEEVITVSEVCLIGGRNFTATNLTYFPACPHLEHTLSCAIRNVSEEIRCSLCGLLSKLNISADTRCASVLGAAICSTVDFSLYKNLEVETFQTQIGSNNVTIQEIKLCDSFCEEALSTCGIQPSDDNPNLICNRSCALQDVTIERDGRRFCADSCDSNRPCINLETCEMPLE